MGPSPLLVVLLLGHATATSHPFPASRGDGSWQWVPIEGSKCMNGSETGVYIRYSTTGNTDLGIYMYGGGACFNSLTCDATLQDPHPADRGSTGIFDTNSSNPVANYNWITVPYCTGDAHMGQAAEQFQKEFRNFNGRPNLELIMARAILTFTSVTSLFITGESAGGIGAVGNYDFFRSHYPAARGILMDDSGPILDDEAMAACLQSQFRKAWNLNPSLPDDCPCVSDGGNMSSVWPYLMNKYSHDSFSLVSSVADSTMSLFFAFGMNNCDVFLPIGYKGLASGLHRLSASGVPVYMIPGSTHEHTSSSEFHWRAVNGMYLNKWIAQLVDPNSPDPSSVIPSSDDFMSEMHHQSQYVLV